MTAVALQNELIGRISSIGDVNLLKSIKENIDASKSKLKLSDFQLNRIKESELQLANGEYIDQDELLKKVFLTPEQIEMLMMSEDDIANGNLITEEELNKMDAKWML